MHLLIQTNFFLLATKNVASDYLLQLFSLLKTFVEKIILIKPFYKLKVYFISNLFCS